MVRNAERWCPAYVGIGSNLDSPVEQVLQAVAALKALPDTIITNSSSLYRSAPMGPSDQPDFINAVAAMLTRLSPHELLAKMRTIEDDQGRIREGEHWGPRTLDLDLLVFGDREIADSELLVPHPGIRERNFVLLPLYELAPHLIVPGLGPVYLMAGSISKSGDQIERISDTWT
jgi:2-amino-4-hydroxy-6-hydroxymethyldihydropteridine diphosphokinase